MNENIVIQVDKLTKSFVAGKPGILRSGQRIIRALDGISFTMERGEILALVGESGCGKSTLALTLVGLERPTSGEVKFEGKSTSALNPAEAKVLRRQIQMIFQDPYESLNPVMTIGEIVIESLIVHKIGSNKTERRERAAVALEIAGLKPAKLYMDRYPHELSGGQRQRVVIAGALILEPSILLADEPVSMLDVSIRAEILNLLADLRDQRGISILYITHDLSTVAYIADRIAVMYLGRIVEIGRTKDVLINPQHPYTRALLSVVPAPNPRLRGHYMILEGETPNPVDLPNYCRFQPRCPFATLRCTEVAPELIEFDNDHYVACILVDQM